MGDHVNARQRKLADEISKMGDNDTIQQALLNAGYPQSMAREGWQVVPNRVIKLLARKGQRLNALGEIDAKTQENLVRGRLVYNVIKGSDKAVQSAKALGSDRRVNMFTPDTQIGVITLVAPTEIHEKKDAMLAELDSTVPDTAARR